MEICNKGQSPNPNLKTSLKHISLTFLSIKKNLKIKIINVIKNLKERELSKGDQFSNWNARPLRKSQIHYAALDAFVCIQLFYEFEKVFLAQVINSLIFLKYY